MLKYVDTKVVMAEVPDEVTLAINISNCPCHCSGCHSSYLAEDIGEELTLEVIDRLIENNDGISCIALMGGDADIHSVMWILQGIHSRGLKTCWYSGRDKINKALKYPYRCVDYIKTGHYDKTKGGLDNVHTNQHFYKNICGNLEDITYRFQKQD